MKQQKISPIIVDINRERLALCSRANPDPLIFKFTPEMISDLEVVNKEELRTKLRSFLVDNKIKPGPIMIILEESVFFEKNYTGSEPKLDEVQNYVDSVPFAGVSSKVFKVGNEYKLVVINRDLYQALQQVFEKLEFPLLSVVPGFVLTMINAPMPFSAKTCEVVYKKLDIVLENSFSSGGPDSGSFYEKREAWLEKHKILVVIITLLLVGICVGVAVLTLQKKPATVKQTLTTVTPKQVESLPTPTIEIEKISKEEVAKWSSEVLNGSGVVGMAASWEAKFKEWGFVNVKTGNTGLTSGAQVTFSKKVPEVFRSQVQEELKKQGTEVVATESAATNFDVVLVIGK